MEADTEVDHIEARVAKELAIRLALGLVFVGLAYFGVADAIVRPPAGDAAPVAATP